ncbi:MAG: ORF6N domain-containing protein [Cytophagales bacterium]|jgi:hypothetical protein|nr:ORF6N domain-containing protein [Cytophagales bacterium]
MPDERIIQRIFLVRDEKVMLDFHLAELYQVETRALKQAVKRNNERFPEDFMFELTTKEIDLMVSQNVIPSKKYLGGALPYAFTESGVAMLSSVLKSKRAVSVNIAIIRSFILLRKIAANYKEIMDKLNELENRYDNKFKEIYKAINYLINPPDKVRRQIGFKRKSE